MANIGTVTQLNALIEQRWAPGLHSAAYNKMKIIPHFMDLGKSGRQMNYRKIANFLSQILTEGSQGGDGLTQTGNTEVAATGTPKSVYVYTAVTDNVVARITQGDVLGSYRDAIELALAEGADIEGGKLATDMTSVVSGNNATPISEATFREIIQNLAFSAKGNYEPGVTEPSFLVHTKQMKYIMGDPAFTQQQYRGDGTPLIKGWLYRAHGANWYPTNNIVTGTTTRNMLLLDDITMAVCWNLKARVKTQDFIAETRLVGMLDFAVFTPWQEYGGAYLSSPN